ncbi:hypothetical protein KUCAC02_004307 [Chaenocephalus aceratus]|uniref:Uncharacterized protein n=1 Tax=Chaenocephalus aceratus TaxID=36190 RepID=A0ACB9WZV2_CHAAC|nr:hypothetical protein KUCAC02_004307 [Chaenocephalus aceratus]
MIPHRISCIRRPMNIITQCGKRTTPTFRNELPSMENNLIKDPDISLLRIFASRDIDDRHEDHRGRKGVPSRLPKPHKGYPPTGVGFPLIVQPEQQYHLLNPAEDGFIIPDELAAWDKFAPGEAVPMDRASPWDSPGVR